MFFNRKYSLPQFQSFCNKTFDQFFSIVFILGMFLVNPFQSRSQSYYFKHYQTEQGLAHNTVYCSYQDTKGFLWFGTRGGLNRFDGYRFRLFTIGNKEAPGNSQAVLAITADRQGKLWIGTGSGLFFFDKTGDSLVHVLDSVSNNYKLMVDNADNLWIISSLVVRCYNPKTKRLTSYSETGNFYANSACLADDGSILFGTPDGIKKYDTVSGSLSPFGPVPTIRLGSRIPHLLNAGNNRFLMGTPDNGLKLFDKTTGIYSDVFTYDDNKTRVSVRAILQYSQDEFWVATESGIFILSLKNKKKDRWLKQSLDPYSLSDNTVYTLCKDAEGGVWAGTYFGGLNYYSPQYSAFRKYYPDGSGTSLGGSVVHEICQDKKGNLWIGTEDAGINKLDPRTGVIQQFKPGGLPGDIAFYNVYGLICIGNDVWIGAQHHGIDVMDVRTGKVYKHYDGQPGSGGINNASCFFQTHDGRLLAGTGEGVLQYNPKEDNFFMPAGLPKNVDVMDFKEDNNNNLWIATATNGVYQYNLTSGKVMQYAYKEDKSRVAPGTNVNSIIVDSKNNVWMCFAVAGLFRLDTDRKTFVHYSVQNGLPSNNVFKAIEDNNGDIWATTSKGLVNIHQGNGPLTVYTQANGLLNDQFNYNSGFKDSAGRIYFGSTRGMISFMPGEVLKTTYIPPLYFTSFMVADNELLCGERSSFVLRHDQSTFSIDFAALGYSSPETINYSYKMQGLGNDWINLATNRRVYFTDLSPGKYIFTVRAGNNGRYNANEKQLIIEVLPPVWATGWAYLLYFSVVVIAAWFIIRGYQKRIQARREKEAYEARLNFMVDVAYEIKTPLTLIKGPVENLQEMVKDIPQIGEDLSTMNRNTDRLINLVTQILDFRQIETLGFNLVYTRFNIIDLLKEVHLDFLPVIEKKGLLYQLDHTGDEVCIYADEEALRKIFSNLLGNAVKYAETKVSIRLLPPNEGSNDLVMEFCNDGIPIPAEMKEMIFLPFYRIRNAARHKGTGIGLTLARSLTELHKGTLRLDVSNTKDTVFVLSIPKG